MQISDRKTTAIYQVPTPLLYLGVGLIAVGVFVALFIAGQVLSIYADMKSSTFIAYMTGNLAGATLLSDGKHTVVIGHGGAMIAAFVSFVLIAWAGAAIAFSLIRAGSQIISPVFQMQMAGIKLKLAQLKTDIRNTIATRKPHE